MYGAEGEELILSEVNLRAYSSGAATVSVSLSTDNSTFGTARTFTLAAGQNNLSLYRWGKFNEGILRFTTTSNAKIDFMGVKVDCEVIGG
jgi:hypothetical protein